MQSSRQEYWNGLPFPSPKDLPHTGIKPISLVSPALISGFFTTSTTWEIKMCLHECWKEVHMCLGWTFYLWHPVIEWDSLCKCSDFSIVFAHFNSLDLSLKIKLTSSSPLQENDAVVDCEPESKELLNDGELYYFGNPNGFFQHTESNFNMNKKYLKDLIKIFICSFLNRVANVAVQ